MTTFERFFSPIPAPGNIYAAYALGVLEYAAYRNDATLIEAWARVFDLPIYGLIETPDRFTPNLAYAGTGTQMVVAVPGTTSFGQMMQNILYSAQRRNVAFGPYRAHSFFLWCAEGIVDAVRDRLNVLPLLNDVCLVGHSLGGAVAQLLGDWINRNTTARTRYVCTFNAPRVGDRAYVDAAEVPTHLYFCSHDMVCELPPPAMCSITGPAETGLPSDFYIHRDDLISIPSLNDINESWFAIAISKVVYPAKWASSALFGAEAAAGLMKGLGFVGSRAALASNVIALPPWIVEHFMTSVLDNVEAVTTFSGMPEHRQLKDLHDIILATDSTFLAATEVPFALAPPRAFAAGIDPGGGDPDDLPAILAGERIESIEAAFDWSETDVLNPSPDLIHIEDSFVEALTRRAAEVAPANPLVAPGTTAADVPARVNWHFRGRDRRILVKLLKCIEAVRARDARTWDYEETATLSTRETMFDWFDAEEEDAALEVIAERVRACLALTREPTWIS